MNAAADIWGLTWFCFNFVRITSGEEILASTSSSAASTAIPIENASTIAVLNCTRCNVWKGDECFKFEPCVFCNESVHCSQERSTVCKDNVCLDINLDSKIWQQLNNPTLIINASSFVFPGSIKHYDPFGKIIALILLTIFMLSILTLCLKVCCAVCGNTHGSLDKRWDLYPFLKRDWKGFQCLTVRLDTFWDFSRLFGTLWDFDDFLRLRSLLGTF